MRHCYEEINLLNLLKELQNSVNDVVTRRPHVTRIPGTLISQHATLKTEDKATFSILSLHAFNLIDVHI